MNWLDGCLILFNTDNKFNKLKKNKKMCCPLNLKLDPSQYRGYSQWQILKLRFLPIWAMGEHALTLRLR